MSGRRGRGGAPDLTMRVDNSDNRTVHSGHDNRFYNAPRGRDFDRRRLGNQRGSWRGGPHHHRGGGRRSYQQGQQYGASFSEREPNQNRYKIRNRRGGPNSRPAVNRAPAVDPNGKVWKKVTIYQGRDLTEDWLKDRIGEMMETPLVPIQFFAGRKEASFYMYVERDTVGAVLALSGRIEMPSGRRMKISVSAAKGPPIPSQVPPQLDSKLVPALSECYDAASGRLDLSNLAHKPAFLSKGVWIPFSWSGGVDRILQVIRQHIPTLQTLDLSHNRLFTLQGLAHWADSLFHVTRLNLSNNMLDDKNELDHLSSWNLTEIMLKDNPLDKSFKDTTAYVSELRKKWPKLLLLNGEALPEPVTFDTGESVPLPPSAGNQFRTAELESLLTNFIKQYYLIFDSGEKEKLVDAYHEEAVFSLSCCRNTLLTKSEHRPWHGFNLYSDNRNLARGAPQERQVTCLKQGRTAVMSALNHFPKTTHRLETFKLDVVFFSDSLCMFSIVGMYDEENNGRPVTRQFGRTVTATPAGKGIVITNDQISITNPTRESAQRARSLAVPTAVPTAGPSAAAPAAVPTLPVQALQPGQEEMIARLAAATRMQNSWAKECLEARAYNFDEAFALFSDLKAKGQIPEKAFVHGGAML